MFNLASKSGKMKVSVEAEALLEEGKDDTLEHVKMADNQSVVERSEIASASAQIESSQLHNKPDGWITMPVEPKSPWHVIASLISFNWWRNAVVASIEYAPFCLIPATFTALSGAVVNIAMMVGFEPLRHNPVEFAALILVFATLLLGCLLGVAFMILGFGGWLVRLGAYSIALVKAPSIKYLAALSKDERKAWFKSSLVEVEPLKIHIGAVLLWVTAYMVFPLIIVAGCTMVKIITMPVFMGAMAIKLPAWIDFACAFAIVPNILFLVIYSFVSLIVSACSPLKPQRAATFAFKLSWKFFWPLAIVSALFAVLSFALGAPSDLLQMATVEKTLAQYDPTAKTISHVWSSVLSVILFPLSFVPICDVLRPQLRDDLLARRLVESREKP
jgi:hypothetical protein